MRSGSLDLRISDGGGPSDKDAALNSLPNDAQPGGERRGDIRTTMSPPRDKLGIYRDQSRNWSKFDA
jgi:hypothetical protein